MKWQATLVAVLVTQGCASATIDAPSQNAPAPSVATLDARIQAALFAPAEVVNKASAINLSESVRRDIETDLRNTLLEWDRQTAQLHREQEALAAAVEAQAINESEARRLADAVLRTEAELKRLHFGLQLRTTNRLSQAQQQALRSTR